MSGLDVRGITAPFAFAVFTCLNQFQMMARALDDLPFAFF